MRTLTAVLVVTLLGAGNLCFGASIGGSQGDDDERGANSIRAQTSFIYKF